MSNRYQDFARKTSPFREGMDSAANGVRLCIEWIESGLNRIINR